MSSNRVCSVAGCTNVAELAHDEATTEARAAYMAAPDLGTNDKARAAKLAQLMQEDDNVSTLLVHRLQCQERADAAERAHKNAYHAMESHRVALVALTALLRGGN